MTDTVKFETGKTYEMRWVTDADARNLVEVLRRTRKFVTIAIDGAPAPKRVGVRVFEGVEYALPLGDYSMAPRVKADRPVGPEGHENVVNLDDWKRERAS